MKPFATGTVVGTGAAINVPLGWTPDHVRVLNITDMNSEDTWVAGMVDGSSMQHTGSALANRAAPNGIALYDPKDANTPKGFTIGAGMSVSGKTLAWIAFRNVG